MKENEIHSKKELELTLINFEDVYSWFGGTIYSLKYNCGFEICGNSACCFPHYFLGEPSYIFYLPGEFEFLQAKLEKKFPARQIIPGTEKYHCFGGGKCVYEYRPIDCRSHPYWPIIIRGNFIGFLDLREPRCPIKIIPFSFSSRMKESWSRLINEYPGLANWLECKAPKPEGNRLIFARNIRRR